MQQPYFNDATRRFLQNASSLQLYHSRARVHRNCRALRARQPAIKNKWQDRAPRGCCRRAGRRRGAAPSPCFLIFAPTHCLATELQSCCRTPATPSHRLSRYDAAESSADRRCPTSPSRRFGTTCTGARCSACEARDDFMPAQGKLIRGVPQQP